MDNKNATTYYIFGGSGFVGSHLVHLLKQTDSTCHIINLDIVNKDYNGIAEFYYCDIRKPIDLELEQANNCTIFNLAAVHRTPGHKDFEYFETNINGAKNVCNFARQFNIQEIIFTSSIAIYGASESLKDENSLPTPNTAYGISKLIAEKTHQIWQAEDPLRKLTIVRPGVVFGLNENGNFTRMYNAIKHRKFAYPGRVDSIKACIYVKDLIHFILYQRQNRVKAFELYNCTYEPAFTIKQIVDTMKNSTNLKRHILCIPKWIIMFLAYIAKTLGSPMGICPARVKKLLISTNISGQKLIESNFHFKYTLQEAISDWLLDSGGKYLK